eukprot:scaffold28756_cov59-Phaeocystis_antarctica.AAC.3
MTRAVEILLGSYPLILSSGTATRIFTSPFGPGSVSSISNVAAGEASEGRTVVPEGVSDGPMLYALARGGGNGGDDAGRSEVGDASDEVGGVTCPVSAASSAACCRCLENAVEALADFTHGKESGGAFPTGVELHGKIAGRRAGRSGVRHSYFYVTHRGGGRGSGGSGGRGGLRQARGDGGCGLRRAARSGRAPCPRWRFWWRVNRTLRGRAPWRRFWWSCFTGSLWRRWCSC